MRLGLGLLAALLSAAAFAGCLGSSDDDRTGQRSAASSPQPVAKRTVLRLVELHQLNGSGVRGEARLLLDGRRLSVESVVGGAAPRELHMQHIHFPSGTADGSCPTRALDTNGDGLVSLEEGARAYGDPAVSLEPFPKVAEPRWTYRQNLSVPAGLTLDRGVVVLHGLWVDGRYDPLMPIACGVIDRTATREIALEPINDSGIAGTARLSLSGSSLYAWISLGGPFDGRRHMQHIHLPKGSGRGTCPTRAMDRNGDGLVSLAEGLPAYGAPAISLEPFPSPKTFAFEYSRTMRVPATLPLDRGVIVVHGMDVKGRYDPMIPVACGAIDPTVPPARASQPVTSGEGSGY